MRILPGSSLEVNSGTHNLKFGYQLHRNVNSSTRAITSRYPVLRHLCPYTPIDPNDGRFRIARPVERILIAEPDSAWTKGATD